MANFGVQIFSEDLLGSFEHYKKAFKATQIFLAKGSQDEPIHLEMDVLGNNIAIAPLLPKDIKKGNVVVLCVKFENEEDLWMAYNVLKEDGRADELKSYPWSALEGYVTDKFGITWCIGI